MPGEIQCLRDEGVGSLDGSCLGRVCDQRQMNLNLIASWYRRCRLHHRAFCEEATVSAKYLPPNFRVIDLQEARIVRAPRNCIYATISYRWGEHEMSTPMPTSKRKDVRIDAFGREWIRLPPTIPRTIADAMNLARCLGIRYFWNDSLCIVQDIVEDVTSQTASMDAVYSSAVVTIVAATSPHADFGLPGMSIPRRYRQVSAKVKNYELAVAFPKYHDLDTKEHTIWNTRGWTLQEKILSRRLIFITDYQVYFKCNNAVWSEDVFAETGRLSTSPRSHPNPFSWVAARNGLPEKRIPFHYRFLDTLLDGSLNIHIKRPFLGQFPNYAAVVKNYTQRALSFESDRIRAIQGVLNTLDIGPFYAGLPDQFFRLALLWQPPFESTCEENQAGLPSWSWTGWKIKSGCVWTERDTRYANRPSSQYRYTGPKDDAQSPNDFHVLTNRGYSVIGRKQRAGKQPNITPLISRYLDRQRILLHFGTTSGKFFFAHSRPPYPLNSEAFVLHDIVDSLQRCVGEILIAPSLVQRLPAPCTFLKLGSGLGVEQAGISTKYLEYENPDGDGSRDLRHPSSCEIVNVMLVRKLGKKLYKRIAVGKIVTTAWQLSGLFRKEVFLA
ncbi:MAG: hypothetical protein Q9227_001915 [Pyrenula ochraceoflavens]